MKERSQNILLVLSSILFVFFLVGVAEIVVRATTEMPFLGVSKNLFAKDRFKDSVGNSPGVTAVAFGQDVHIDADGFRIPDGARASSSSSSSSRASGKSVLILGDSVAFGPGVAEEKTFAGLLRRAFPDRRFVNAAVMGYAIKDYENVLTTLLERGKTFERVFLFFCLNDVSPASGEAIRQYLGSGLPTLRSMPLLEEFNAFVRERSKLYLIAKGWLTDPRKRYFLADEANYTDVARVEEQLQPIARMARLAGQRAMPLTVVIVPYAYQMRPEGQSRRAPQNVLAAILRRNQVDFIDLFGLFLDASSASADMYLPDDQTHLSVQGHKVLSEFLGGLLRREALPGSGAGRGRSDD